MSDKSENIAWTRPIGTTPAVSALNRVILEYLAHGNTDDLRAYSDARENLIAEVQFASETHAGCVATVQRARVEAEMWRAALMKAALHLRLVAGCVHDAKAREIAHKLADDTEAACYAPVSVQKADQ